VLKYENSLGSVNLSDAYFTNIFLTSQDITGLNKMSVFRFLKFWIIDFECWFVNDSKCVKSISWSINPLVIDINSLNLGILGSTRVTKSSLDIWGNNELPFLSTIYCFLYQKGVLEIL
jgi:hypothetical protein